MPQSSALERLRAKRSSGPPRPPKRSWFGSIVDSVSDFGEGVYETGRDMVEGGVELVKKSAVGSPLNPHVPSRLRAQMEMGQMLPEMVEPITEQMSRPENAGMFGQFGAFGKGAAEVATGIPFRQVARDFEEGNYAKGLGHATPGLALLGLGARAMKPKPVPAPVPPPPVRRLLPAHAGPTGVGGGARFVHGARGVADAASTNMLDVQAVQPNFRPGQGTVLPQEVNAAHPVRPDIAATYSGAGDLPPVRDLRSSAGIDPLRSVENQAFEALVPNRYKTQSNINPVMGEIVDQPRPSYYPREDPSARLSDPTHWRNSPIFGGEIGEVAEVGARPTAPPRPRPTPKPKQARKAPETGPSAAIVPEVMDTPPPAAAKPINQPKPKATADRPYATVSDGDLKTLANMGDKKAAAELATRAEGNMGFYVGPDGVAVDPPKGPLGRLGAMFGDETGAVGPGAGDLIRQRRMAESLGARNLPPEPPAPMAEPLGEVRPINKGMNEAGIYDGPLPGGTQGRLRDLGIPEEKIQSMTMDEANALLRYQNERGTPRGATPMMGAAPREVPQLFNRDARPKGREGRPTFGERLKATLTDESGSVPRRPKNVQETHRNLMQEVQDRVPEIKERRNIENVITERFRDLDRTDPRAQKALELLRAVRARDPFGTSFRRVNPGVTDDIAKASQELRELSGGKLNVEIEDIVDNYLETGRIEMPDPDFRDSSIGSRIRNFLKDEDGSAPIPQLGKIDFDKPIDAGGGKGNILHRVSGNEKFDTNFSNWVNARRATTVEGILKRREFKDLDGAGFEGIKAFQAGIKSGRFKDVTDYFNKKHADLEAIGVKLGFRENYLPQLWENSADEVFQVKKRLGLQPQFTLERVLENYQKGIEAGLKPKYKTIGELIGWYESRANKAIADRQFFDFLRESKQILPDSKAPTEWELINPKHFPVQKFATKRGDIHTKNYYAPKPVADAINNYLTEGHGLMRWVGDKASLTKNIVLSAGIPKTGINAHGFNLAMRHVMGRGLVKGGAEAAKWIVNPKSARRWLDENLTTAPDAMKHGLTLTTEEHLLDSTGSVHLLREPKTAPGKLANKGLNKVLKVHGKLFEDPLFQNIVPAMKLKHYNGLVDDLMKQGMEATAAKKAAAETTNGLYGGINWEAMQRSRDLQNLLRGVILAPDWFETQYRIGKGMGKTLMDPKNPRGIAYKRAAANLVGAYLLADVTNYAINGKHMWENPPGHALDIRAGEVGGKIRYIRPFGTAADFARLPFDTLAGALQGDLSSPVNILKNRRSTIFKLGTNIGMNVDDFGSPILGDDKFGRPQPIITQLGKVGREVAEIATPQYLSGSIDLATGRAGSAEEAVLGSVEMPVRYSRESTRKRSRNRPQRKRTSR